MDIYVTRKGLTPAFVLSLGKDNGRAFRDAGFRFPNEDGAKPTRDLADALDEFASKRESTHGRYFPRIEDEPDLAHVATRVAESLRGRDGRAFARDPTRR